MKERPLYAVYIMATTKYRVQRLVYYERFVDIRAATTREKQLKGWRRDKKIALIRSKNPTWIDLSEEWGKPIQAGVTGPYIKPDNERRNAGPSSPAATAPKDGAGESFAAVARDDKGNGITIGAAEAAPLQNKINGGRGPEGPLYPNNIAQCTAEAVLHPA